MKFVTEAVMHLSFVSPWVDPRDTPVELFFVTNKNLSKLLGKGHQINDKQPFPRGKHEHPQHNIEIWYRNQIKWREKTLA